MDGALEYMDHVNEAFHDEPAKYDQFLEILLAAHTYVNEVIFGFAPNYPFNKHTHTHT